MPNVRAHDGISSRQLVAAIVAAVAGAIVATSAIVVRAHPDEIGGHTLTPNDGLFRPGVNGAVWTDDSGESASAADVAAAADAASTALTPQAIWLLQSGRWDFFLPALPSVSTLTQVPPVASLIVIMISTGSGPTAPPTVEALATGLDTPWGMAFTPDGALLITERGGFIRLYRNGALQPNPVADLRSDVRAEGEGGLLGIAVDPAFAQNRHIYVYHSYTGAGGAMLNRVVRYQLSDAFVATSPQVVIDGIPGSSIHNGGRIEFGPDGMLYITAGDAAETSLAQETGSLGGKILRIRADGTVPDNPFGPSAVYSMGHRNPQGLDWDAVGQLYATEHGPVGQDEVNRIFGGSNYGWPTVTGAPGDPRFVDPLRVYTPSIAPSGATFYDGSRLPCWQGDYFFATLRGAHLHRLDFVAPGQIAGEERLLDGQFGRLRDVEVGPDGLLYVITSNRDGRGDPAPSDDRLLRISIAC